MVLAPALNTLSVLSLQAAPLGSERYVILGTSFQYWREYLCANSSFITVFSKQIVYFTTLPSWKCPIDHPGSREST